MPKAQNRPVTTSDMNLNPEQDEVVVNVIIDGHIIKNNLDYTGNDEMWIQKQLVSQGVNRVEDVFLATCDSKNNLSVYLKKNFNKTHDVFE